MSFAGSSRTAWSDPSPHAPLFHIKPLAPAGLVQLVVDAARRLGRDARHALELLRGSGEHLVDRAEVLEQRPAPCRAYAFEVVEDRREPARVAEQVPALRTLMETRAKLRDLMSKVDRSEELEGLLEKVLQNENELKTLSGQLGIDSKEG